MIIKKLLFRSSPCGSAEIHGGRKFDSWPGSVSKGSSIAVNCGVGRRCGWDLALLWLWRRLAATVPIPSLGTSICRGCGPRKDGKKNGRKKRKWEQHTKKDWKEPVMLSSQKKKSRKVSFLLKFQV